MRFGAERLDATITAADGAHAAIGPELTSAMSVNVRSDPKRTAGLPWEESRTRSVISRRAPIP